MIKVMESLFLNLKNWEGEKKEKIPALSFRFLIEKRQSKLSNLVFIH
jgi:hypothetical protein